MSTDDDRERVRRILAAGKQPAPPLSRRMRRMAVLLGKGRGTRVRNALGVPILCAWDDCQSDGFEEHKVIVREPSKTLHYVFCSERHRQFHIAGHRAYGNAPQ